jgi:hypothetical protein
MGSRRRSITYDFGFRLAVAIENACFSNRVLPPGADPYNENRGAPNAKPRSEKRKIHVPPGDDRRPERPASIPLIFGLSGLFFLFGIGTAIDAAVKDHPAGYLYAFGGTLASLIAAVIVVWRLTPEPTRKKGKAEESSPIPVQPTTSDDVLVAIVDNIQKALRYTNEAFREAVKHECNEFRGKTGNWSRGLFEAHARTYNQILLSFYEGAKSSLFCTSIPKYLPTWQGPLGDQIMNAHAKSRAQVTRVFLFNKRGEVTAEVVEAMRKQAEAHINVRVFFGDESAFEFPPDVTNDFSVIDGEVIGITSFLGDGQARAEWHVNDENNQSRFEGYCDKLIHYSVAFNDFERWWTNCRAIGAAT